MTPTQIPCTTVARRVEARDSMSRRLSTERARGGVGRAWLGRGAPPMFASQYAAALTLPQRCEGKSE
eukprot:6201265-Pleurochrysis_carterae.AAC.7